MIICITGENGFIGSHLAMCASRRYGYKVVYFGRPFEWIGDKTIHIDRLIHCAAIHRDKNQNKIYDKNMEIHQSLIDLLNKNNFSPSISMLSSIQEGDGTPYGTAKADGSNMLAEFCKHNQTNFSKYNLNNIFGPYSQPNKYSFVATFCFNILNDIPCNIVDRKITLSYIDDVVNSIILEETDSFQKYNTTVLKVYEKLIFFKKHHLEQNSIPRFSTQLDFLLYKTLLSFINFPISKTYRKNQ